MSMLKPPTCCGDCGLLLIIVSEPGQRCHRLQLLRESLRTRVRTVMLEGLDAIPSAIPTPSTQAGVRILLDALDVPMPRGSGVGDQHEPSPLVSAAAQADVLISLAGPVLM